MGEAIGAILTPAVGVALSPLPIVAVILMLFSAKARTNGPAFVLGWVIGLAGVLTIRPSLDAGERVLVIFTGRR